MKRQQIRKALVLISLLLFPITIYYFSPYVIILGAAGGIITGSFVVFALLFLLSLFLGRAFCGYVCPAGGLQQCLMQTTDKKAKGGKRNLIKYCIWVPWIGAIAFLFLKAGGIRAVDPLYLTTNGISVAEPFAYIIYYGVVGLIVVLSFTSGKRAFCHYVCWMAPFMVMGTKISQWMRLPRLHLEAQKSECTGCKRCTQKCPMSLDVHGMVEKQDMRNSECILCGECVDVCMKKAIQYAYKHEEVRHEST